MVLSEEDQARFKSYHDKRLKSYIPPAAINDVQKIYNTSDMIPILEVFESVANNIETGAKALRVEIKQGILSVNFLKNFLISPNVLQFLRFVEKTINLRGTQLCLDLEKDILWALNSSARSVGFSGPSGIGKSYSILYNYVNMRRSTEHLILYVSNAESFIENVLYLVLVFCFSSFFEILVPKGMGLDTSPMKDIGYENCSAFIESFEENSCRPNESQILQLLWAYYLHVVNSPEIHMVTLSKALKILKKLNQRIASSSSSLTRKISFIERKHTFIIGRYSIKSTKNFKKIESKNRKRNCCTCLRNLGNILVKLLRKDILKDF